MCDINDHFCCVLVPKDCCKACEPFRYDKGKVTTQVQRIVLLCTSQCLREWWATLVLFVLSCDNEQVANGSLYKHSIYPSHYRGQGGDTTTLSDSLHTLPTLRGQRRKFAHRREEEIAIIYRMRYRAMCNKRPPHTDGKSCWTCGSSASSSTPIQLWADQPSTTVGEDVIAVSPFLTFARALQPALWHISSLQQIVKWCKLAKIVSVVAVFLLAFHVLLVCCWLTGICELIENTRPACIIRDIIMFVDPANLGTYASRNTCSY